MVLSPSAEQRPIDRSLLEQGQGRYSAQNGEPPDCKHWTEVGIDLPAGPPVVEL